MSTYRISVINHVISACNDQDLDSLEEARKQGITAAIAIGSDEITKGNSFFGAEVLVENGGETLSRFIVAIGASQLQ